MRRGAIAGIVLALLILGAFVFLRAGPAPPDEGRPDALPPLPDLAFASPRAARACTFAPCFEPTLAIGGGRWALTDASGSFVSVSTDGGATWRELPAPLPPPTIEAGGDGLIDIDEGGALWLSVLARPRLGLPALGPLPQGEGIHLARSLDGGLTWRSDFVPLPGDVDRQWLIVAGSDVWITYNDIDSGIRIARSTDGGVTFAPPVDLAPGAHIHGRGVLGPDGRLFVPYFGAPETPGLAVARSDDGGATWRHVRVEGGAPGDFFPAIARDGNGTLALAWRGPAEEIRLAISQDGGETWSLSQRVSAEGARAGVGPWVGLSARGTSVVSLARGADARAADAVAMRVLADGLARGVAATGIATSDADRPGNTDFASAALTEEGDLAVVWTDRAAIHVARERAP